MTPELFCSYLYNPVQMLRLTTSTAVWYLTEKYICMYKFNKSPASRQIITYTIYYSVVYTQTDIFWRVIRLQKILRLIDMHNESIFDSRFQN